MCEARALWPEATSLFKFLGCERPLLVEDMYNTMTTGDECKQKQRKDLYETASVQIYARATRVVVETSITGVLEHIYLPTNGGNETFFDGLILHILTVFNFLRNSTNTVN